MPDNSAPSFDLKKIERIVENFFEKIEEKIEIKKVNFKEGVIFLNLTSKNNQILIGEKGKTLFSFQHLLKKILIKELGKFLYLDLDINGYKKRRIDYLKDLTKSFADEVVLTKKEKEFLPMPPYERRIIHLEIAKRKDVASYSIGKEGERRVIIKPR